MDKLLEFFQIGMVDNQVKSDIIEVNFFDLLVKFDSLQNFERISVNVQNFVRFDLCVATLNQRLFACATLPLTILFRIKPFNFFRPLLLDNFDHITFVFGLEYWQFNFDRHFSLRNCLFRFFFFCFGHIYTFRTLFW